MSRIISALTFSLLTCALVFGSTATASAGYLYKYQSSLTSNDGEWSQSYGTVSAVYTASGLAITGGGEYGFMPSVAGAFTAIVHLEVPIGSSDTSGLIVRYAPVTPADSRIALLALGSNSIGANSVGAGSGGGNLATGGSVSSGYYSGWLELVASGSTVNAYYEADTASAYSLVTSFAGVPVNAPILTFAQYGSSAAIFSDFTLQSNDPIGQAIPEPSTAAILLPVLSAGFMVVQGRKTKRV